MASIRIDGKDYEIPVEVLDLIDGLCQEAKVKKSKSQIAHESESKIVSPWISRIVEIVSADAEKVVLKSFEGESLEISVEILIGEDEDEGILTFGTAEHPLSTLFERYNDD